MKTRSLLAFFLLLAPLLFSQRVIQVNGKFGIVKKDYPDFIVPAVYRSIQLTPGHFFIAEKDHFTGLLDSTGKTVIPFTYTSIEVFDTSSTLLTASQKGSCGLISNKGKIIIPLNYDGFTSDLGWGKFYTDSACLLVDGSGNIIFKGPNVLQSKGDLFIVSLPSDDGNSKAGLMTRQGKYIMQPFIGKLDFVKNLIRFKYYNSNYGLLDENGNMLLQDRFTDIEPYKANYYSEPDSLELKHGDTIFYFNIVSKKITSILLASSQSDAGQYDKVSNLYGYRKNGRWLIEPKYQNFDHSGKYLFAHLEKQTDVYDTTGHFLKKITFPNLTPYDGFDTLPHVFYQASVGEKTVLVNDRFEQVGIPYAEISVLKIDSKRSLFLVYEKEKYGVIDQNGKVVMAPMLKDSPYLQDDFICVPLEGGFCDIYNLNGKLLRSKATLEKIGETDYYKVTVNDKVKICRGSELQQVLPGEYDDVSPLYVGDSLAFFTLTKNEKAGLSDTKGKLLLPFSYTSIDPDYYGHGSLLVSDQNGYYFLDGHLQPVDRNFYKKVHSFNTQFLLAEKNNGKKVFLDHDGKLVSNEYDEIIDRQQYYGTVNGKLNGLLDGEGKEILACEWDSTIFLSADIFACKGGRYFHVDAVTGTVEKGSAYDSIALLTDHETESFAYKRNGKWSLDGKNFVYDDFIPRSTVYWDEMGRAYNFRQAAKWGLIFPDGKILVPAQYDSPVHSWGEKTFWARKGDQLVHFDSAGKVLMKTKADWMCDAMSFTNVSREQNLHTAIINRGGREVPYGVYGGKYGLIDGKGHVLQKPTADTLIDIHYRMDSYEEMPLLGFAWLENAKWHMYTTTTDFQLVEDPNNFEQLDTIRAASLNMRVTQGKWGFVNAQGKMVIPTVYDEFRFRFERVSAETGDVRGYMRKSYLDSLNFFIEPTVPIDPLFVRQGNKWGAFDYSGKKILPVEYDSLSDAMLGEEVVIQAWKNGSYGYFSFEGIGLLPVSFTAQEELYMHSNDKTILLFQQGGSVDHYQFTVSDYPYQVYGPDMDVRDSLDAKGNVVMRIDTIHVDQYKNGTYGVYDPIERKWLVQPVYEDIQFPNYVKSDGEETDVKRYISMKEKLLYKTTRGLSDDDYFVVKQKGRWGIINPVTKQMLAPAYDSISIFKKRGIDTLISIYNNGKRGLLDTRLDVIVPPSYDLFIPVAPDANDSSDLEPSFIIITGGKQNFYDIPYKGMQYTRYDEMGSEIDSVDASGKPVMRADTAHLSYFTGNPMFGIYDRVHKKWIITPECGEMVIPWSTVAGDEREVRYASTNMKSDMPLDDYNMNTKYPLLIKKQNNWYSFEWKTGKLTPISASSSEQLVKMYNDKYAPGK